jgi:hypothetical protein
VNRAQNGSARLRLPTPHCAALRVGDQFMTYLQYQQCVRTGRPPARLPLTPFNPLDPAIMRAAANAVIYPPLTRQIYEQLVSRCRGPMIFGM